jgi:hypothetical protein
MHSRSRSRPKYETDAGGEKAVIDDRAGDACAGGAILRPEVDIDVDTAFTDDWDDINNPRALTAFAMSLMVSTVRAAGVRARGGLLQSLRINGQLSSQAAGIEPV